MGRVVVVGLGPAGADHVLPAARAALEAAPVRFVRTDRHPAVDELATLGITFESLDHCYEEAASIEEAYRAIVTELVDAAHRHDAVVYAVPGNPAVAERTPQLLRDAGAVVEIVAGMSFADLAWARLGIDPLERATTVVDAHLFSSAVAGASGRLLIGQCDSKRVLSDVKLGLLEHVDGSTPVTVAARLGCEDELVASVPLEDLDRRVVPDHLTSLFVDVGTSAIASDLAELYALVERLRGPGGCPWDAEQTHHTLARHAVEEAYEVAEAIARLPADAPGGTKAAEPEDYDALRDELGDLLFQVFIHAALAREAGAFTIGEVSRGIHDKLVRRHPHVFGDVRASSPDAVVANWEQIKQEERDGASLLDGIPGDLPSLVYVAKLLRKLDAVGLEPRAVVGESGEATVDADAAERALGLALVSLTLEARERGLDAETVLRGWAGRLADRFRAFEARAAIEGVDLASASTRQAARLWTDS